jgi:hypothetical protein
MLYMIIAAVVVLAMVILIYYSYAKSMKLHNAETTNYTIETAYKDAPTILETLLEDELAQIKKAVPNIAINAVTQCLPIKSLKEQAVQGAVEMGKKLAWRAAGIRVRYVDRKNAAYILLSNKELHYVHFVENVLEDHRIYDSIILQTGTLTTTNNTDLLAKNLGITSTLKKIVLQVEGEKEEIILMPAINLHPDGESLSYGKTAIDFAIMGKYFEEKITQKLKW